MTFDPYDPEPDYTRARFDFDTKVIGIETDGVEVPEETYRLALESAQRWLNNYRLSPAMRLRALRSVVGTALADADVR